LRSSSEQLGDVGRNPARQLVLLCKFCQWEVSVNIPDGSSASDLKSHGSAGVHTTIPSIIPSIIPSTGAVSLWKCQFIA
jgi:hypothetical protein